MVSTAQVRASGKRAAGTRTQELRTFYLKILNFMVLLRKPTFEIQTVSDTLGSLNIVQS
jgi:hypothetical protein